MNFFPGSNVICWMKTICFRGCFQSEKTAFSCIIPNITLEVTHNTFELVCFLSRTKRKRHKSGLCNNCKPCKVLCALSFPCLYQNQDLLYLKIPPNTTQPMWIVDKYFIFKFAKQGFSCFRICSCNCLWIHVSPTFSIILPIDCLKFLKLRF